MKLTNRGGALAKLQLDHITFKSFVFVFRLLINMTQPTKN